MFFADFVIVYIKIITEFNNFFVKNTFISPGTQATEKSALYSCIPKDLNLSNWDKISVLI